MRGNINAENSTKIFQQINYSNFFIIGLIRQKQIDDYQNSIHQPNMTGISTLYFYIVIGICLLILSSTFKAIYHSNQNKAQKMILKVLASISILTIGFFIYDSLATMNHI